MRVIRDPANEKSEATVELTIYGTAIAVVRDFPSLNSVNRAGLCGEYGQPDSCQLFYMKGDEKVCIENQYSPDFKDFVEYWR